MGPCPLLVAGAPEVGEELIVARSAGEAHELAEVLPQARNVHLVLPEHEQLTMY